MQSLSKRSQYGLRAAIRLARRHHAGEYVQSRDLADEEGLPTKFLEQVLLTLRRGGLLESKVGSGGGYRLKRPPERVTVGELLAALDPDDAAEDAGSTHGGRGLSLVCERLDAARSAVLDEWLLSDLADEAARDDPAAMYHI